MDATYTVRNNAKKILRLDFNTTQRIDILTFDPSGKMIEKWSEDRLFLLQEGVVIVNPKERIEYSEKVATRDMKPQEPYTIKADVVGYPDYSAKRPSLLPLSQPARRDKSAFRGSDQLNNVLGSSRGGLSTVIVPRRRGI